MLNSRVSGSVRLLSLMSLLGFSAVQGQSAEKWDVARTLVGTGNSATAYSCSDGSELEAQYDVLMDRGPVVVLLRDGAKVGTLNRYLSLSPFEISQCTLGISDSSFQSESLEVMVCYQNPEQINRIEISEKKGSRRSPLIRCEVSGRKAIQ